MVEEYWGLAEVQTVHMGLVSDLKKTAILSNLS